MTWLLEGEGYAVTAYDSGEAFLAVSRSVTQGCLVLDVRMPEMSGLELHERLSSQDFPLPILFVTGHGDVPMAVSALQRGACDFIEKPFHNEELLRRIQRALKLDAERLALAERHQKQQNGLDHLTLREREILAGVVAGKLNKQIADELQISMKTVEAHRSRVMEKMGARTAGELVATYMRICAPPTEG